MAIKYEAYTWSGEKVTGVLDTYSEEDAYEMLRQEELVPYRLRPVRPRRSLVQLMPWLFPAKPQDILDFTNQLASLLKSGIPLRRALTVQSEQTRNLGLKSAVRQIVEDVEAGQRFSDALSRHRRIFPEFYIRLLSVGESAGGLVFTLEQLHNNLQRRKAVTDKVKSTMTYPAITLGLAFVAALILVKYSLPKLIDMLDEFGGELPLATRMLQSSSQYLEVYALQILMASVAAFALMAAYSRTSRGRRLQDTVLLKIPLIGGVMMSSNMFILTSTFVTLLEAGVPPIEALRLTKQGLVNVVLRDKLEETTEDTAAGVRLGEAFSRQRIFPSLVSQSLAVGEMRGTQVDTLRGLAAYYEQQTERALGMAMEMIQPLIITIVAGLVGFVAVAVIAGIYSTLATIE